ncbi:MAG: EAL domain-containing protein [Lachnospiraceae bacterium]|nr:EAL domain-containing protein [Lachnospiraceae bacterium]
MKLLVGSILAVALAIIGIYVSKTERKQHRLVPAVRRILMAGFVIVFFYIIALLSSSPEISLFGYSAYYAAMMWLFYFLLYFALEYTGSTFEQHVNNKLMLVFLTINTLSFLTNNLWGHLFDVKHVTLFTGEEVFEPVVEPFYYVHYAFTVLLALFCLIALLDRWLHSAAFYRMKYLAIAMILLVMVGLNIHGFQSSLDFSIIGYVAEVICIYYCAFVYTPQSLMQKSLSLVTQDMTVGLIVMDLESKIVYSNQCADEYMNGRMPLEDEYGRTLEQWCRLLFIGEVEEGEIEKTFYKGTEPLFFKIELRRLLDGKEKLQGYYFLIQDRTDEINRLRIKQYQATHDRLTGLYNKEYFYEQSEKYIDEHLNEELLIVCTDIKDFKMINDFFGSEVGDLVLKNYAKRLQQKADRILLYGRLANDNFAVLMRKDEFDEAIFDISIQEAFAGAIDKEMAFALVTYVGVYEVVERELLVSVMCGRARMAVATIKGNQHRRVAYYDNELRENIVREQELIADFKQAIEQEQLQIYLHPQMNAEGKMLGAEGLVRWIHPTKGMIMPSEFIPVFEKNGLIIDVDRHVWEMACRQLRRWKDAGRTDVYISVNLSSRDFYFLNIYQVFTDLVKKYEISPKNLKLEITETAVMMDFERQLELIHKLREFGFVVEMDDFGSGYSSLNMLKDIHVDVLKLDMAFLQKNQDTDRGKKILQMVIGLSRQLGIPVISEGVETIEQVSFLSEMGCEIFQGFYFARPMAVEQFEKNYFK